MDTERSTCSSVATNQQIMCPCLHRSIKCDWVRAGCSHPVIRLGFISFCSAVGTSLIRSKTHGENQPTRQTDSQLDRKQSSICVGGCCGWFMPCSGMLHEFRAHCYYRNRLNGHCLFSHWHIHVHWMATVKMSKCDIVASFISLASNFLLWHLSWQWATEMNHSMAPIWVSRQSSDSLRPDTVGQPVGSWLPSKSEKLWYASLLHSTTQSRSFSECCGSLRGLPLFQKSSCTHGLQITKTSESHSHFLSVPPLLISQSYS